MNERIKELFKEAYGYFPCPAGEPESEKFAELIIKECTKVVEDKYIGQLGTPDMGWSNGYDDGLKTAVFLILKHFGFNPTYPKNEYICPKCGVDRFKVDCGGVSRFDCPMGANAQ